MGVNEQKEEWFTHTKWMTSFIDDLAGKVLKFEGNSFLDKADQRSLISKEEKQRAKRWRHLSECLGFDDPWIREIYMIDRFPLHYMRQLVGRARRGVKLILSDNKINFNDQNGPDITVAISRETTKHPKCIFQREGDGWFVKYEDMDGYFNGKGLHYLAILLESPNEKYLVENLYRMVNKELPFQNQYYDDDFEGSILKKQTRLNLSDKKNHSSL